jgi:thiol:disulfide interchange protein
MSERMPHDQQQADDLQARPAPRRRGSRGNLLFGIALLAIAAVVIFRPTEPAPVPAVFEGGEATLAAAVERAEAEDRVVFAVATADWCAPCQAYKEGALTDPRVAAWVAANAVPLYLNVDESPEDARALNISGIPASFVIRGGEVVARQPGRLSADELMAWLEAANG